MTTSPTNAAKFTVSEMAFGEDARFLRSLSARALVDARGGDGDAAREGYASGCTGCGFRARLAGAQHASA